MQVNWIAETLIPSCQTPKRFESVSVLKQDENRKLVLQAALKHHRRREEIQEATGSLAGVKEIRVDAELWQFYQNWIKFSH